MEKSPQFDPSNLPTPEHLHKEQALRDELLAQAGDNAERREQVERTFDPENAELADAVEDELDFDALYPLAQKVYALAEAKPELLIGHKHPEDETKADTEPWVKPAALNFWQERIDDLKQHGGDPELAKIFADNDRDIVRLSPRIMSGKATPTEATEWYHRLGATNPMTGSDRMLLKASELATKLPKGRESSAEYADRAIDAGTMILEAAIVQLREQPGSDIYKATLADAIRYFIEQRNAFNQPGISDPGERAQQARAANECSLYIASALEIQLSVVDSNKENVSDATSRIIKNQLTKSIAATIKLLKEIKELDPNKQDQRLTQEANKLAGTLTELTSFDILQEIAARQKQQKPETPAWLPRKATPRQDKPYGTPSGFDNEAFDFLQVYNAGTPHEAVRLLQIKTLKGDPEKRIAHRYSGVDVVGITGSDVQDSVRYLLTNDPDSRLFERHTAIIGRVEQQLPSLAA